MGKRREINVGQHGPGKPKMEKTRPGSWRYFVTCEGLKNGEPVVLQHAWRAMTPEETIAQVKKDNREGLDDINKCKAVEIPGSYKQP